MALKIKRLDRVIILSGRDKGKTGIVQFISINQSKIIVQGINFIKKHQKGRPEQNISASIIKKEALIHISNVAILNPDTKKADRIGFKFIDGKKVRFLKSNNQIIK
ncbi:50S ribosomal protein L24 [Buchnera aphidicola (Takecallis taiwana)]|uniref:50S ribosomal protein L24 n=1 Tax=Buchnera aphidicola TaxID=9 RepID=UPI0031B6FA0C